MTDTEAQDLEHERALARQFAHRLRATTSGLRGELTDYAIATALFATGLQHAGKCMDAEEVVAWLRGIADAIDDPQGHNCAGTA